MQPLSSFLRATELPTAASTLFSVQQPMFVRFLTFLYWVLSFPCFTYFAVTFFLYKLMRYLILSFILSYLMKPLGETSLILLSVVHPSVVLPSVVL